MSILSDLDIKRELGEKVIIEHYNERNLGNCSYDVTLGPNFYRTFLDKNKVYNPYNKQSILGCWSLRKATTVKDYMAGACSCGCKGQKIDLPDDTLIIMLNPRETILAHTNEFIGGRGNVTTMMKARSSIGRNFIEICKCAGWGDVGYVNRWTMEITNNSDYYIPLIVGSRIAQIVFMYTGQVEHPYQSKYQTTDELTILKEKWQPSDMLPKMYLDKY
jgi:dCTP deaminase